MRACGAARVARAEARPGPRGQRARYVCQAYLAFEAKRESNAEIATRFLPGQRSLANVTSLVARGFNITDALELGLWKGLPMMMRERLMGTNIR